MKIKIPSFLKIGGHNFRVVLDDTSEGFGRRAEIDYKRLEIRIVPNKHHSVKSQGLIHELVHAIDEIYLNRQIETENIIEPLAEGIWQFLEQLGIEFNFDELTDESKQ